MVSVYSAYGLSAPACLLAGGASVAAACTQGSAVQYRLLGKQYSHPLSSSCNKQTCSFVQLRWALWLLRHCRAALEALAAIWSTGHFVTGPDLEKKFIGAGTLGDALAPVGVQPDESAPRSADLFGIPRGLRSVRREGATYCEILQNGSPEQA